MNAEVQEKIDAYPGHIKLLILQLRGLVFSVAEDSDLGETNETLKWGDPSYQVKNGSPIRMA